MGDANDNYDKAAADEDSALFDEAVGQEEDSDTALQRAGITTVGALVAWWIASASPGDSTAAAGGAQWGIVPMLADGSGGPRPVLLITRRW